LRAAWGGGMFSFAARLSDGRDPALSRALEEAGYLAGAACHLSGAGPAGRLKAEAERQTALALDCLAGWPASRRRLEEFFAQDATGGATASLSGRA
jgi:hypothetical protein